MSNFQELNFEYNPSEVIQTYKDFRADRKPVERIWDTIDQYENNKLWDTLRKKFPKHQLLVETNYLKYIKKAKTNSIYTGRYYADIKANHAIYDEAARQLNKFVQQVYTSHNVGLEMAKAGSCASTKGLGGMHFGWDSEKIGSYTGGTLHTGEITVDYVDIMNLVLDPTVTDVQKGQAVFIPGQKTIAELKAMYPDEMEKYLQDKEQTTETKAHQYTGTAQPKEDMGQGYTSQKGKAATSRTVKYLLAYYKYYDKTEYRVDQHIIIDDDYFLKSTKDIRPSYFPIVLVYSLMPEKDVYASQPASDVLKNVLTINVLKSMKATHAHMTQNRAQLLKANTNISQAKLARNMYNPKKVITATTKDIKNVMAPIEIPDLPPTLNQDIEDLVDDVHMISGVDLRYAGRDTGSATTTGGVGQILERTSVVSDNGEVFMLEYAAKAVTKLIVDLHIEHSGKKEFLHRHKNKELQTPVVIDFPKMKLGVNEKGIHDTENLENNIEAMFDYSLEAGPLLPKNRARLAEAANIIMEKQMQYRFQPQLMTAEEWLSYQDFPQKDMILDRMRIEQLNSDQEEISSNVMDFSTMTQGGLSPEEAVQTMAEEKQLRRDSTLGNVVNANSFQNKQG